MNILTNTALLLSLLIEASGQPTLKEMSLSRPVNENTIEESKKNKFRGIIQSFVWETIKFVKNRAFIDKHYICEMIFIELGYTDKNGPPAFKRCRYYDYMAKLIMTELSSLRHRTEKLITKACNGK